MWSETVSKYLDCVCDDVLIVSAEFDYCIKRFVWYQENTGQVPMCGQVALYPPPRDLCKVMEPRLAVAVSDRCRRCE
jgi:hypothetical protein